MNKNDKIGAIVPCNWWSYLKEWDRKKQQLSRGNLSLCLYLFVGLYVFFLSLCLFPHLTTTLFKASTSLLCNMNQCMNAMKILNNSTPPPLFAPIYIYCLFMYIEPLSQQSEKRNALKITIIENYLRPQLYITPCKHVEAAGGLLSPSWSVGSVYSRYSWWTLVKG